MFFNSKFHTLSALIREIIQNGIRDFAFATTSLLNFVCRARLLFPSLKSLVDAAGFLEGGVADLPARDWGDEEILVVLGITAGLVTRL